MVVQQPDKRLKFIGASNVGIEYQGRKPTRLLYLELDPLRGRSAVYRPYRKFATWSGTGLRTFPGRYGRKRI